MKSYGVQGLKSVARGIQGEFQEGSGSRRSRGNSDRFLGSSRGFRTTSGVFKSFKCVSRAVIDISRHLLVFKGVSEGPDVFQDHRLADERQLHRRIMAFQCVSLGGIRGSEFSFRGI